MKTLMMMSMMMMMMMMIIMIMMMMMIIIINIIIMMAKMMINDYFVFMELQSKGVCFLSSVISNWFLRSFCNCIFNCSLVSVFMEWPRDTKVIMLFMLSILWCTKVVKCLASSIEL